MVHRRILAVGIAAAVLVGLPAVAVADHSWGSYHWARTSNPFTLELGDNVSSSWDYHLAVASADWTASSVLNTTIVAGGTKSKPCRATLGRVEVCGARYGRTGWLGLAQIWVSGSHIGQAVVKVNDTYFQTATYNTPAWRALVMCQEVGHTFGLDHQDENFDNPNLGTCMDYTADPDGPPSNEHPNAHDHDQLESIYAHLDGWTSVGQSTSVRGNGNDQGHWGRQIRGSREAGTSLYVRELAPGQRLFTFVIWAR